MSTSSSAGSTLASGVDDRLYAFEAAGLLLGQEELPAQQQLGAIEGVMRPLLAQIAQQLPLTVRHPLCMDAGASWLPLMLQLDVMVARASHPKCMVHMTLPLQMHAVLQLA